MKTVVGIVGSYRKGGITAATVEAVLEGARANGAKTQIIYLGEQNLKFCTNCRECAQKPGLERGKCVQQDSLEPMLQDIEAADALVLGSAVNYGGVTAIFRQFMERLTGFYYWPWGQALPKLRKPASRKAVLVASAGMPGFLVPVLTNVAFTLRGTAKMLGARPVSALWMGRYGWQSQCRLLAKDLQHAREIGAALVY